MMATNNNNNSNSNNLAGFILVLVSSCRADDRRETFSDREVEPPMNLAQPPSLKPPQDHIPGGLPMISDSAFSLVILVSVSIYRMFYHQMLMVDRPSSCLLPPFI